MTPRQKELEKQWSQKKEARKREGSEALVWIAQIPPELAAWYRQHSRGVEFEKPKHLRGPALIKELIRLGLVWGDKRFFDCVDAMVEHQVVDQKYDFTGRHGPHLLDPKQTAAARRRKEDIARVKRIRFLMKKDPDLSERSACEKVAAESGRGASFGAERDRLRQLSREARKTLTHRRDRVGNRPRT